MKYFWYPPMIRKKRELFVFPRFFVETSKYLFYFATSTLHGIRQAINSGELPAKGASHPLSQLAFLPNFVIILDEAGNIFWYLMMTKSRKIKKK